MEFPKEILPRTTGRQTPPIQPVRAPAPQHLLEAAQIIESMASLPQVYHEFFHQHLSEDEAFPYTVLTPAYDVQNGMVTAKLLCAIEHTFYVLEVQGDELIKVCYPIDEIQYMEVSHRPADLQIMIHGLTNLGLTAASLFGCSRASSPVVAPLLQRIRLRLVSLNEQAPSRHMERLDHWQDQDNQVIAMARHCLMPGETVIDSVLQPAAGTDRAGMTGAAHLCILTDKELAMIGEVSSPGESSEILCHFVPLNKIHSLTVTREHEGRLSVSVRLLCSVVFEALFDSDLEHEVSQFLERTYQLLPRERAYLRD